MWEIIFPYVSVQGWVVNPDKHGFLYGSCQTVLFSANNFEVVH